MTVLYIVAVVYSEFLAVDLLSFLLLLCVLIVCIFSMLIFVSHIKLPTICGLVKKKLSNGSSVMILNFFLNLCKLTVSPTTKLNRNQMFLFLIRN